MKLSYSSCLIIPLSLLGFTNALRLQVAGRRNSPHLLRRDSVAGSSALNNSADISYFTNVTLNGDSFSVLIDTGSADLWVAGSVSNAVNTGKTSGVSYAVGSVTGPIKTASLDFLGYTVSNQAFLEVTPDSSNPSGQGLIGLGPSSGSNIYGTIPNTTGASVCDRIFLQNTSTPNYITVNLGRLEDPSDTFPGNITIGEVLDTGNLGEVTSQPKMNVTQVSIHDTGDQHFQILLDSDGIIGPDNQSISITTEVDSTSNNKQATAVLDTGFSLSQVPKSVASAFYSRFSGAEYTNVTGVGTTWIVPCDIEVNLTFKIGGVRYPIHPLDATLDPSILGLSGIKNSNGQDSCIGLFQPISFDVGNDPTYDIILGMSFIRNVYALFNYGDFIAGTSESQRGDPYLQFLSTTDLAEAHSDFVTVRLNGDDTTGTQTLGAPNNSTNDDNNSSSGSDRTKTIYIALAIGAGALALILSFAACCLRRRQTNKKIPPSAAWGMRSGGAYSQLNDLRVPVDGQHGSAPIPPYSQYDQRYDHEGEWGQQLYDPPQAAYAPPSYQSQPRYSSPWDHQR